MKYAANLLRSRRREAKATFYIGQILNQHEVPLQFTVFSLNLLIHLIVSSTTTLWTKASSFFFFFFLIINNNLQYQITHGKESMKDGWTCFDKGPSPREQDNVHLIWEKRKHGRFKHNTCINVVKLYFSVLILHWHGFIIGACLICRSIIMLIFTFRICTIKVGHIFFNNYIQDENNAIIVKKLGKSFSS